MNFTRDPIIETVITPREGCKLVVRSSKVTNQESYLVEALEVVSFGHSLFFRSQERPKSFLVPVSDYEITESKEPKMMLKNASVDHSIKIGGGREMPSRPIREAAAPENIEEAQALGERPAPPEGDRKPGRDKRRRGRRGRDRNEPYSPANDAHTPRNDIQDSEAPEKEQTEEPKEKAPSFISKLFPPPTTLIKETIGRYKTVDPAPEDLKIDVQESVEELESGQGAQRSFEEEETTDEQ